MEYIVRSGAGYVLAYKNGFTPYITSNKKEACKVSKKVALEIVAIMEKKHFEGIIEEA